MASELITRYLCDRHLIEKDERVYGMDVEPNVLGLGLDLCATCRDELLGGVEELLAKVRTPKPRGRPTVAWSPRGCPRCSDGREFSSRTSLHTHLKTVHKLTGLEASRMIGASAQTIESPCDVEGCDFVAAGGSGLSAHKRVAHGLV